MFKEEEEAIKVDLHEGCGRTKLFWVMALADSKTLKAMVEFREGTKGQSINLTAFLYRSHPHLPQLDPAWACETITSDLGLGGGFHRGLWVPTLLSID